MLAFRTPASIALCWLLAACGTAAAHGGGDVGTDGTLSSPDGASLHDSGILLPDISTAPPDGSVVVGPDGSTTVPDGGVVIGPDGSTMGPDGSTVLPDGGLMARIGTPCTIDSDCPGLFCSPASGGFGYCSWICGPDEPCPDDAVCATFSSGDLSYCMQGCDPTMPMCAPGFLCSPGIAEVPVCYEGCSTDADCEGVERCGMGVSGVRECYTPGAEVGAACASSGDCPDAGYCLDEASWGAPHGMCVTFCDLTSGSGCGTGSTCVAWGYSGAGSCVPTCDDSHPCRTGYACVSTGTDDPSACVPRCTSDSDCNTGATCSFVTGRCSM